MQTVLDCPIIRNMERTGTLDGKPEPEYICPVCGDLCEQYILDGHKNIVGCNECRYVVDAKDYFEEEYNG